jgi:hypothetical protein
MPGILLDTRWLSANLCGLFHIFLWEISQPVILQSFLCLLYTKLFVTRIQMSKEEATFRDQLFAGNPVAFVLMAWPFTWEVFISEWFEVTWSEV